MSAAALDYVETALHDGRRLRTPFWRIDSDRDGPTLLVVAAQHGNEVQGSEVIRRLAAICAEDLVAGTMLLVPFMNLLAVRHRRNSIKIGPEEKHTDLHKAHNINGQWPGDPRGGDVQRLAYALDQALVQHCTHVIDLHCWCKFWATATLATDDGGESRRMGEAAGTRFIRWGDVPSPEQPQLRATVIRRGGAGMAMELSGQYCVYEREVRTGLQAVGNVARMLGMLPGEPELPPDTGIEVTDERETVVEAPCQGLFVADQMQLEQRIEAGQRLGHLIRADDLSAIEITAPVGGWLWRFGSHRPDPDVRLPDQHPWSDPGDPLASIVST